MKYKNRFLTLAAVLLVSCSVEPLNEPAVTEEVQEQMSEKICNTSRNAIKGTLIAKFNEDAIPYIEEAASLATKSGGVATRSGILSVDEVFARLDVKSFERIFPAIDEFEENTRAAGLHRWYQVTFDESQNLDEAAKLLANIAEISTIQFSTPRYKTFSGEAIPLTETVPAPATKGIVKADFNDPDLYMQWHYINNADMAVSSEAKVGADINVVDVWKETGGDNRVIVAIVDEGVKYTHPDLAANMWTNPSPSEEYDNQDIHGWNFVDNCPISWDKKTTNAYGQESTDSGHGTHVAGTVAAVNNNGIGVAGVAGGTGKGDGVKLMSCQVFSAGMSSTDVSVSKAIKYAADHGAVILQCSYGSERSEVSSPREYKTHAPLEREALDYFMSPEYNQNTILDGGVAIYAAGNEGLSHSNFPGGYEDCISVTAIAPDFLPANYTNYGGGCNIAAPGGETSGHTGGEKAGILSTLVSEVNGGDYGYMQGTSMACPHVSGVAALGLSYALQHDIKLTREEFIAKLLTSVNDLESKLDGNKVSVGGMNLEEYKGKMGTGLIDAYQLIMQIEGTPCLKIGTDRLESVSLTQFFGAGAEYLTYTGVTVSDVDMDKLSMPTRPVMENGQLKIRCNRPGVAHIKVTAIAGGSKPGSETIMGGMVISKEFAVIARDNGASNGGWL